MGGLVPQGFAAYARIFHPGYAQFLRWTDGVPACEREGKLRWRELARLRGTVSHPLMQWREVLAGPLDLERGRDGWQYEDAWLGGLPEDEFASVIALLARHTQDPARCTAGLWEGWGSLSEELGGDPLSWPSLELPNRNYLLFDAALDAFADAGWPVHGSWPSAQAPNQLWPEDHGWFLASDVDFDSTVVGGSRELIDALVACRDIEALHLPANASLAADADTVNGRRGPVPTRADNH